MGRRTATNRKSTPVGKGDGHNVPEHVLTFYSEYRKKKIGCRRPFRSTAINRKTSAIEKGDGYNFSGLEWTEKIPECPVYYPSKKEFANPFSYLQKISPEASKYGICKIVSPLEALNPAANVLTKEKQGFNFHTYVQPLRLAKWDKNDQATFFKGERKYSYKSFKKMADEAFIGRFSHSQDLSLEYLEKVFWYEMFLRKKGTSVEYAVNVEGSAFSRAPDDPLGKSKWNLKTFPKMPKSTLRLLEYPIPGITDPMLYIGMLFSMFAWHVEDHYLYSMNYHHAGAPKTWYGVPGDALLQFEKVVLDNVYSHNILSINNEDGASKLLEQKTTMFPPNILLQNNVPVYKAHQRPGEFVVTFPRAYHAGFNNGFGCGEAVNFATDDWFPFGSEAAKRYARLQQSPILPFEELLCKEMIRRLKKPAELFSSCPIEVSFQNHLNQINSALWKFKKSRAWFNYSPRSQGSILCSLCKRDCYLGFVECSKCCRSNCLFHGVEILKVHAEGVLHQLPNWRNVVVPI
ncbi:hypothetical protein ACFE04_027154 [Oxalis oulophora]